jgi:hypothetical protein
VTCSMATAAPPSEIHLATFGRSPLTQKTCRSTRSAYAPRPNHGVESERKEEVTPAKINPIPEGKADPGGLAGSGTQGSD